MTKTAATSLAWLKDHCLPEAGRYPEMTRPWSLGAWSGATDGKHFVAVKDPERRYPEFPETLAKTIRPFFKRPPVFKRTPPTTLEATAGELREFCGLWADKACNLCDDRLSFECGWCDGSGKARHRCERCDLDHECVCSTCEGSKKTECTAHGTDGPVKVLGVTLKCHLLGRAVDIRTGLSRITLSVPNSKAKDSIAVYATGFVAVVMAFTGATEKPLVFKPAKKKR